MIVIGVDPGMCTGVAMLEISKNRIRATADQFEEVSFAYTWVGSRALMSGNAIVLIEDFTGGGHRTKESNHTLKVIGHFFYGLQDVAESVIMRTNQQRLKGSSFVTPYADTLPGPHGLDALKHCFSYVAETNSGLLRRDG